ncbi:MAG: purine-nucleoside phosphorylase [Candidatus Delongbacteria bacterium]|nr:purine-nucleoside phosphorylase [Candidatus Delongbacteria bacterium]
MENGKLKITDALEFIRRTIDTEDIEYAIVLGSGLGAFTDSMDEKQILKTSEIPNYPVSTVLGHEGSIVVGKLNGIKLLVFSGRIHLYEGYTYNEVVFPVETVSGLNIPKLILTNAAGCINDNFHPGDLIIISEAEDPLYKLSVEKSVKIRTSQNLNYDIIKAFERSDLKIQKGVYGFMTGPTFETPSEIRLLKKLGIDLVGMSTVPELIRSLELNIETSAISLVTNYAAGISDIKLSHQDVFDTAKKAQTNFVNLLRNITKL